MSTQREARLILGMRVDVTSFADATEQVVSWALAGESRFVCAANVHTVVEAHQNAEFRDMINRADLVTPDGMPLVWALRNLKVINASRVDGPTLTLHVCRAAEHKSIPIGLYGSTPDGLDKFVRFLRREFPELVVACAISPPFRDPTPLEDEEYVREIIRSGARILFVFLGCPKQERWIFAHRGRIPAVMLGVGAAVDFFGGSISRAPLWMQRTGLEWLYRLCREPRRLAPRYFKTIPKFMYLLARQFLEDREVRKALAPSTVRNWPKVLLVGYRPPPFFGPSVTYETLLRSEFTQRFDVSFLDITLARDMQDLERFRFGKILRSLRLIFREISLLVWERFDLFCAPLSLNRTAFVKDAIFHTIAIGFRVPTLIYSHGNNVPQFHDESPRWVQKWITWIIRKSEGVIVLGETLRFNFTRWLPQERIFVVPTGIEKTMIPPRRRKDNAPFTVLYLGNLFREKGLFDILHAATLTPRICYVFAGAWCSEVEKHKALEFVRQHGLTGRVEFLGPVTGATKWQTLADADALVFPTTYRNETLGLVILEGMQAGLPIIATARGAIPEIIQHGINGLLVPEHNPVALAEAIVQLATNPEWARKMGATNRIRWQQYYTREEYGRRMIAAVSEVIARRRAKHKSKIFLFGLPIDNLTCEETLARIDELIQTSTPHQHAAVNVDKIVKMHRNPEFRDALLDCDLISPDGQPVVWISHLFGTPLKQRVTGIDLFEALIPHCATKGYRVFFLGAKQDVLEDAVAKLKQRAPDLKIVGYHHGYWDPREEQQVVAKIRESRPDILFLAMTSPKKELFAKRWKADLHVPFVMGIGGTLDVVAGRVRRAPRWMQACGLEWLFRLLQEPRRMWRRYLLEDTQIFTLTWREWRQRRRQR